MGDKSHLWRNSIDVFDSGIWANIDQLLTAALLPTAAQSTGYNCTHGAKGEQYTTGEKELSANTQPSVANTNIDYHAAAVYLRERWKENESSVSAAALQHQWISVSRGSHQLTPLQRQTGVQ